MLENRTSAVAESTVARAQGAELPSRQRARRTNDPLAASLSANTASGRRLKDLITAYMTAAGNPVEVERRAAVVAAAELVLIAELARERALAGTDVEVALRAQGAADRAVRRLGIELRSSEPPRVPLRERWAAEFASENEAENEDATAAEAVDAPADAGMAAP